MKKIILLLGLCVTFYACDGNTSAAKELITADLMEEMEGEGKVEKIKLKEISEGDDHWDDRMSDSDLAFYHSTVELLVIQDNSQFNEGDKLKAELLYAFETDDDGKLTEIDDSDTDMLSIKVKKKGESTWEDLN
tara:strand:+ start:219 stop:620 length:402 start_codon:yes stop_codon:yes gene_type:complete